MRIRSWFAVLGLTAFAAGNLLAQEKPVSGPADFEPPVRLKAGKEFIDTGKHIGHAGPFVMDFNGDGKPDLLVGNFAGHIQVYLNTGTRTQPQFTDEGLLETDGLQAKVPNW